MVVVEDKAVVNYMDPRRRLRRVQVEILAECASGGNLRTAAVKMGRSYSVVTEHAARAKDALNSTSIAQAVAVAISLGIISTPTGSEVMCVPLR